MSKKVQQVLKGEELCTEDNFGYAVIRKSELDMDSEGNVFGGDVYISYGQDGFPPHSSEKVAPENVESKMREVQPDLRKWK